MSTELDFNFPMFRDLSTWHLANLAGCGSPDRPDGIGCAPPADLSTVRPSPGAKFLRSVADDMDWRIKYYFDDDPREHDPREHEPWELVDLLADEIAEVADGAVPIYTGERWAVFADLAAWQEDPGDIGGWPADLTDAAGAALYLIAERLARALVEKWGEELAAGVDA